MANHERQSLVKLGDRPRADVLYEALLGLVVAGGMAWILEGIITAPSFAENVGAGGNVLIKSILGAIVVGVAVFLGLQTIILNGRLGFVHGLVRGDVVYLAAPEGLAGIRSKRLRCDGTVTMAMRTDAGTRGSSSTPATRARFESGGSKLGVVVNRTVGEPGEAQAAIRGWLEGHGVKVDEVPWPSKGTATTT